MLPSGSLGLFAWYDFTDNTTLYQAAETPVASADDPIGIVVDKSGNGRNLTAPSDAARPLWKTTCADWDGVDTELNHTAWTAGDSTTFWVVKNDDADKGSHISVDTDTPKNRVLVTGSAYDENPARAVLHTDDSSGCQRMGTNDEDWNIVELVIEGTTATMLVNGVAGTPAEITGDLVSDSIGPADPVVVDADWWFDGQMAEIVRYSKAINASTRTKIRNGLASKHSIANTC